MSERVTTNAEELFLLRASLGRNKKQKDRGRVENNKRLAKESARMISPWIERASLATAITGSITQSLELPTKVYSYRRGRIPQREVRFVPAASQTTDRFSPMIQNNDS